MLTMLLAPPLSRGLSVRIKLSPAACHSALVIDMVQKVVEIVGISKQGFSEAAQDAISVCARTVRGIKWAKVTEMECKVVEDKIVEYRSLVRIYFDVES